LDLNVIYIVLGLIVVGIFTMWLEGLIGQTSFRIILAVSTLEFIGAIVLHLTKAGPSAAMMLVPLPTLIYFRLCRLVFVRVMRREPVNTAYNWESGLFLDRVFAMIFMFGVLAMLLLAMNLSKAGW
jgi:hypothetical protein